MAPVFIGLVFGAIGAAFMTQLIRSLLFEVEALDPVTFMTAAFPLAFDTAENT